MVDKWEVIWSPGTICQIRTTEGVVLVCSTLDSDVNKNVSTFTPNFEDGTGGVKHRRFTVYNGDDLEGL